MPIEHTCEPPLGHAESALSPNLSRRRQVRKLSACSRGGIVVSQNRTASVMGARVLQAGGHAVDAAVATAVALGVVEPWMSRIGRVRGGGPAPAAPGGAAGLGS